MTESEEVCLVAACTVILELATVLFDLLATEHLTDDASEAMLLELFWMEWAKFKLGSNKVILDRAVLQLLRILLLDGTTSLILRVVIFVRLILADLLMRMISLEDAELLMPHIVMLLGLTVLLEEPSVTELIVTEAAGVPGLLPSIVLEWWAILTGLVARFSWFTEHCRDAASGDVSFAGGRRCALPLCSVQGAVTR